MEFVIIGLVALFGSSLTFFSGFGLGTILLPVFAVFFPLDIAIALTAIVHFLNNIFKILLVGKHVNRKALLLFGIPSFVAALAGAYTLTLLSHFQPLCSYWIMKKEMHISLIKIMIAILMMFFALLELNPSLFKMKNGKKQLLSGGLLSGFFGGLSGHQGALRSVFLLQLGLSKQSFVATGTAIAIMVDLARLSVYSVSFLFYTSHSNLSLITVAVLFAFIGAYSGSKLLNKITVKFIQNVVAVMLIAFALLIGAGIL